MALRAQQDAMNGTANSPISGPSGNDITPPSSSVNPAYKAVSSAIGMVADGLGVVTGSAITMTGIGLIGAPEPTTLSKWAGVPLTAYGAAYTTKSVAGFTLNATNLWTAIKGSVSDSDYLPGSALELAVRTSGGSPEMERAAVAVDMGWGLATGRVLDARMATGVITNPRIAALLQPSTYTTAEREITILAPNTWNVVKGIDPRVGLIDLVPKSYENIYIPFDSSLNNK